MAMQELFLEIYLFILCINGGIMVVDAMSDTPIISPFDVEKHCFVGNSIVDGITTESSCNSLPGTWAYQNVTATTPPSILEYDEATGTVNGTLFDTITGNQTDSSFAVLDPFVDAVTYPIAVMRGVIDFLTGGFIWQAFNLVGLPAIFVVVLQSVIGLLLVRTIIYYVVGR